MKIKVLLAVMLVSIMCGCERGLGEYVYTEYEEDGFWHDFVLHTDRKCPKIKKAARFELTEELKDPYFYEWCANCVTDRQAKQLKKLNNENTNNN